MIRQVNRGSIISIPDLHNTGQYKTFPNPNYEGMPEIISFTDFLRWNYTSDYGNHIRKLHHEKQLPLPEYTTPDNTVLNVTILDGKYDDLPEQAFLSVGTIEDVVKKAESLK